MRKQMMALTALLVLLVVSATSFAGWERINGRTYWTEGATASTCFTRDKITGDVYPVVDPAVYDTTIRLGSSDDPSFGFWGVDTNGDFYPLDDVSSADYDHRNDVGQRVDVEWEVTSTGDLALKD